MNTEQERRIRTLLEEFEKFGNEGYIFMPSWVALHGASLEEALENPCGTAACICGKAGLMQVFREEGFQWNPSTKHGPREFSISPDVFFGREIFDAVFCGWWCKNHIHTPAQAVIVLRAFLEEALDGKQFDTQWYPGPSVEQAIEALNPSEQVFPVSRLRRVRNGPWWLWASWKPVESEKTPPTTP